MEARALTACEWFLILTKSLERGMPKGAFRSPINEANLGHKNRLGPMNIAQTRVSRKDLEGCRVAGELIEPFLKIDALLHRESCSYATGINQTVVFVDTKDQRSESGQSRSG